MAKIKLFWFAFASALVVVVACMALAAVPPSDTVELQILEGFYKLSYGIGLIVGLLFGIPAGMLSVTAVKHRENEGSAEFDARVAHRGLWTAIAAAAFAFVVSLLAAATYRMELSAIDQVSLVLHSLLIVVCPSLAMAVTLVAFATTTRLRRWGGTFSLTRR